MNNNYTKILQECMDIANERQDQYGEATNNLQGACNIMKELFGIEMSVTSLCKVVVALKFSREKHQHKDDNIKDIINYLAISLHNND